MPYRGVTEPRIACAAHAAAEAAGACSRCRVPLCDPCTLYFLAEAYCRRCIVGARRGWALRVAGGVTAVVAMMLVGSAVMLAAVPRHAHPHAVCAVHTAVMQARHDANCVPADRWIAEADHSIEVGRPYSALHALALSQRDCGGINSERDRLYAESYMQTGDRFAAIAAAVRYVEATNGSLAACAVLNAADGKFAYERRLHRLCPQPASD